MTTATAYAATPLVQRLAERPEACFVDPDNLPEFLQQPGEAVLFFSGDAVRFPEGQDVAVVLPELGRMVAGGLRIGVVPTVHEDALAAKFNVQRWPSLVWLRDGKYVATIAGMLDWDEYVQRVNAALATPATRVPGIGIPVVAAGGGAASSCH
jgi:hydrogenase-1 operon protein HyaE